MMCGDGSWECSYESECTNAGTCTNSGGTAICSGNTCTSESNCQQPVDDCGISDYRRVSRFSFALSAFVLQGPVEYVQSCAREWPVPTNGTATIMVRAQTPAATLVRVISGCVKLQIMMGAMTGPGHPACGPLASARF